MSLDDASLEVSLDDASLEVSLDDASLEVSLDDASLEVSLDDASQQLVLSAEAVTRVWLLPAQSAAACQVLRLCTRPNQCLCFLSIGSVCLARSGEPHQSTTVKAATRVSVCFSCRSCSVCGAASGQLHARCVLNTLRPC